MLVPSQRFRSRAFVGVEQSSRLEQFVVPGGVVEAGRDVGDAIIAWAEADGAG